MSKIFSAGAIGRCGDPQPARGGASSFLSSLVKLFVKLLSSFSLVFANFSKFFFGHFVEYQGVILSNFAF